MNIFTCEIRLRGDVRGSIPQIWKKMASHHLLGDPGGNADAAKLIVLAMLSEDGVEGALPTFRRLSRGWRQVIEELLAEEAVLVEAMRCAVSAVKQRRYKNPTTDHFFDFIWMLCCDRRLPMESRLWLLDQVCPAPHLLRKTNRTCSAPAPHLLRPPTHDVHHDLNPGTRRCMCGRASSGP